MFPARDPRRVRDRAPSDRAAKTPDARSVARARGRPRHDPALPTPPLADRWRRSGGPAYLSRLWVAPQPTCATCSPRSLRETARVLKPGARFVILEFATPRFAPLRAIYLFYFRRILPAIGRLVSKHRDAYTYLPESVLAFPEPEALSERLRAAGFSRVGFERLTGGICAVHYGTR